MLMSTFRFRWSIAGIAVGLFYYCNAAVQNVDGFEWILPYLQNWDHFELDELLLGISLTTLFLFFDCVLILRSNQLELERARIYRATLDSTHHIMNNFLNQAQLLELVAEDCPHIDPEIISMYHSTIAEAMQQLEKLDNLEKIEPERIRQAVSPDILPSMAAQPH